MRIKIYIGLPAVYAPSKRPAYVYRRKERTMNISNIRPDNPTIAIEGQATGETPVNVTPEGWTAPKRSNYDRVKSMTVEEMAELFEMIPHSGNPSTYTIDGVCIDDGLRTKRQWLDWLKQEAKE